MEQKAKKILTIALAAAFFITSGMFAYTYTTATGTIGITEPTGDVVSSNATSTQPDWDSLVPAAMGGWAYRKKITIDHTQVSADLDYFPVLIDRTDVDWRDIGYGGHVAQSDGGDILFTSSDEVSKLDHEIEKYTPSTGEVVAWVEIPELSASTDTEIYMYYGNSDVADQWNVAGTWDSNFTMVQHLKDDPDSSHTQDSTANDHDGTKGSANNPVETDGKIGKAQDFSSDQISCGNLGIGDNYTAECWIKADTLTGSGDQDTYGFTIMASAVSGQGYPLWLAARGTEVRLWAYESASGSWRETTGAGLNTTNNFYIVATAISGSTTKVYVNGVERLSFTNDGDVSWTNIFTIGDLRPGRAIYFDGIIEEVRISDTIRNVDWIETCYSNQDSPASFYDVEAEEKLAPLCGEVPTGDIFTISPNPGYTGDLVTKVYLTNAGNLTKAYSYLNMKLYMAGSVEADETPNYQLLTLENGKAALTLQDLIPVSGTWTQTSQGDFEGGTLNQVYTTTDPDDVLLDTFADNVTDSFDDETKIASSSNVTVSGGQVKLSGASGTETLRPNAAGDETNITNQYPDSGVHWDKVDDVTSDNFSTYVYSGNTTTAGWYDPDWQYRKKITIDHTKVSANVTDFPVLISRTDVDWKDTVNGGHVGQSDGGDILFTSSNGTSKLDHEIEEYTSTTGELIAWVEVPALSASADTEIYIYYGNAGAADQWNVEGTWNSNFKFVCHTRDDPDTSHVSDSTSNNNDGTKRGANEPLETTGGKIDSAQDFDGTNDYIGFGSNTYLGDEITVSLWVYADALSGNWDTLVGRDQSSSWGNGWGFFWYQNNLQFYVGGWDHPNEQAKTTSFGTGQWYHVVGVYDGSTITIYTNNNVGAVTGSTTGDVPEFGDLIAGGYLGGWSGGWLSGIIDEVRISDTARSAGWIETSYNNQDSPSTFYDVTSEEAAATDYERDLYNIPDHSTGSGTINGVTVYFRIAGDNVTGIDYTGYGKAAIKTHGTVYEGDEESQTGKTFVTKSYQWTTNPYTGSAWTWNEIDALQIGVSLKEQVTSRFAYCTQVYVVVAHSYDSPCTLMSINLLSGETVYTIDSFDYTASSIPSGTSLKVQFSTDNTTWYSSAGTLDGWDTLSTGTNSIDLSGLGWTGSNLYYRMLFTSDGSDTPVLDEVISIFSTCYTSGDLTSSAYDTEDDLDWDWGTISFTISEPASTNIQFQIRTAATEGGLSSATWYGPTGTGDYYTTSGTAINSVHDGDRWIQYKAYFTGPGDSTPIFSDISITYTVATVSYTIEIIGGSYSLISGSTSEWESGWTITPEFFCEVTPR